MTVIKFGTDGWRAVMDKEFTPDNVARVAYATAQWVKKNYSHPSVVIGYDCRKNGALFAAVAAQVLCGEGVKVYLADGFVSTPMISLGTFVLSASAGVIITASHNPPEYNGYKLKSNFGGPSPPQVIREVEMLIPEKTEIPPAPLDKLQKQGILEYIDLESLYCNTVEESFDLAIISKLPFVYDAMYGAGQNVMKRLFPNATLLHCEHDPTFKGIAPEPLHKNLQELASFIKNNKGLLCGIATDGDADRIGMYDSQGRFVDSHHIILLLIHYLYQYKKISGKVVLAFSVSEKVKKLCAHYGLPVTITPIGFKHIAAIMLKEDVLIGGEESGGIAVKGHIPERDGIWTGLLLLECMATTGKTLEELIQEVYDIVGPFAYLRDDLHLTEEQKTKIIEQCNNGGYGSFGNFFVQKVVDTDGYKFYLSEEEWVMLRASGTEPVLRVYCEAENLQKVADILQATKETILA